METTITDMIADFIINYAEQFPIVLAILIFIGTAYGLIILCRLPVHGLVKLTKTQKDDKWAKAVYDFLDRFGPSFRKIEAFAKEAKAKKEK